MLKLCESHTLVKLHHYDIDFGTAEFVDSGIKQCELASPGLGSLRLIRACVCRSEIAVCITHFIG